MEKLKEIESFLKNAKHLTVLHQNMTVRGAEKGLPDTCVFSCDFYNNKYCMVQPPFKLLSRIVKIE
jgi:hypothetical protein